MGFVDCWCSGRAASGQSVLDLDEFRKSINVRVTLGHPAGLAFACVEYVVEPRNTGVEPGTDHAAGAAALFGA